MISSLSRRQWSPGAGVRRRAGIRCHRHVQPQKQPGEGACKGHCRQTPAGKTSRPQTAMQTPYLTFSVFRRARARQSKKDIACQCFQHGKRKLCKPCLQGIWDRLLEVRILLQKSLAASQRLPRPDVYPAVRDAAGSLAEGYDQLTEVCTNVSFSSSCVTFASPKAI